MRRFPRPGGVLCALALACVWARTARAQPAASAQAAAADAAEPDLPAAREQRFLELLRTYPERKPELSFALVGRLVDAGPFAQRDRAEYWLGSAQLSLGDREGARSWFARLARDYPDSPWTERSLLGLGDALSRERRYDEALAYYARAEASRDAAVRELGRLDGGQARTLRTRQRWAWAGGAFAAAVMLWLLASVVRRGPPLWPLPAETRIAGPVLVVLALLSLRQDPAPRAAVLEVASSGLLLLTLSGLRLRALPLRAGARAWHALLTLSGFFALAWVAIYRADLVGMVEETFRAGPE